MVARILLATFFAALVAVAGPLIAPLLLFQTPFVSPPLFERIPGVSGAFCTPGTRLVVERYGRSATPEWKNYHRVQCIDAAGRPVEEVTNQTNSAALLSSAGLVFVAAWPVFYLRQRRWQREAPAPPVKGAALQQRFLTAALASVMAFCVGTVVFLFHQETEAEMERAALVLFGILVVLIVVMMAGAVAVRKRSL